MDDVTTGTAEDDVVSWTSINYVVTTVIGVRRDDDDRCPTVIEAGVPEVSNKHIGTSGIMECVSVLPTNVEVVPGSG